MQEGGGGYLTWPKLSVMCMTKPRAGPQHCLWQVSDSSAAKNTCWPKEFLMAYLLEVSQLTNTKNTKMNSFIIKNKNLLLY